MGALNPVNLVAFIESPLQALNLLEYSQRFSRPVAVVVVADRPSLGSSNRAQIEAVLALTQPRQIIVHESRLWPQKPRVSKRALDTAVAALRPHLSDGPYEFVVGEFRSTFVWGVLQRLNGSTRDVVVLDDGTAMLRISRRRALPRTSEQWRQQLKRFMFSASGTPVGAPRDGLNFFTAYPLEDRVAIGDTVVHNDYRTLSAELRALPPDDTSVYVIGTPHREAGVVDEGDVELALELTRFAAASTGKDVVYMAHRRESAEKLDILREGVTVVTPPVPFEIYPRVVGKRPRMIVGYYSSLFATVAELLGDTVEITALEIPRDRLNDSWLSFVDDVYRYYRTELESVVRIVDSPTASRPSSPGTSG